MQVNAKELRRWAENAHLQGRRAEVVCPHTAAMDAIASALGGFVVAQWVNAETGKGVVSASANRRWPRRANRADAALFVRHWHVWRISPETRAAAFLSRAYTSKTAANKAARAIGSAKWRIVQECRFELDCPSPPRVLR